MYISKVSKGDLDYALEITNSRFDNNIIFNRCEARSKNRFLVTLRCVSSKEAGHSLGYPDYWGKRTQRRLVSACWHVHGTFIDELPAQAEIRSSTVKEIIHPGEAWNDFQVGSIMFPMMMSEKCECE